MSVFKNSILRFSVLSICCSGLIGCSSTKNSYGEISDPFESTNRAVFAFNTAVDKTVIHPVLGGYRAVVPDPAREGVSNFLTNLKSPVTFANQVLQGDIEGAATVLTRAIINSLLGFGLFDVAGKEGIEYEPEDFGQTLATWGIGHGPYFVVPFLGPASLRDSTGFLVDSYADPIRYWTHNVGDEGWYHAKAGADYLVLRDSLMDLQKDLEANSVDYYAAVRSIYYQRREALVNDSNDVGGDNFDIPDYDEN